MTSIIASVDNTNWLTVKGESSRIYLQALLFAPSLLNPVQLPVLLAIPSFHYTNMHRTNPSTHKAAIDFRNEICGGEEAIQIYSKAVALQGAEAAAEILGTEIMSTEGSCMLDCALINVRLPLEVADPSTVSKDATSAGVAIAVAGAGASNREREKGKINPAHGAKIVLWIKETGIKESGCYIQTCLYRGAFWWRLSGMIYVDVDDFRRGAEVLKGLCERIREGGYLA